jgi:signal transduction histidine kinase/ActR/RegA family two-component response regulator
VKLRTSLFALVAGTAVPLVALAAVLAYFLLAHETATFRAGAQDRNRAFMTAVDTELRGHFTALRALAASQSLERDDMRAFQSEAMRVVATHPAWSAVILADRSGQQLVNTKYTFGERLPRVSDTASFDAVVNGARPEIGHVAAGPRGNWAVPMRLPILRDGAVRYILTAPIRPDAFLRLIQEQHFPDGWAAGLLDSTGRFVARVPERAPGSLASTDLRDALAGAPEGWYRGSTLEGSDAFTAFRTSEFSRWTVAVSVPATQLLAAGWHTAGYTLLGAVLSLLLAVAIALVVGGRIAAPIAAVASRARAMAHGNAGALTAPAQAGIDEVRALERALAEAGDAVLEREMLRDREETALKAADRAKDEFLAMLGHELRNPLSAITASAHVLRLAHPGDAAATRAHGVIERQTRQMTRLVEDLLDVSRLTMGKVSLEPERFDLAELVRSAVLAWRSVAARPEERVQLRLESAWVCADRARIEQVVGNLLDNADKFSPSGSAIRVRVARSGEHALLEVEDRGEGIPPDMLARIFDAFVQAPQDLSRSRGGMGLGLALVRRLVELHHGSVTATSGGAGTGATFTVRLPIVAPPHGSAVTPLPADAGLAPQRILVVEDNEDARTMLATMLELEGHQVRAVGTGAAALETAHAWHPVVMIVDIGLPDIDGYAIARRMRELAAPPRLLALSGYGQAEDERRAYDAGFDVHLTKPVDPELLRRVLAGMTRGAHNTASRPPTSSAFEPG